MQKYQYYALFIALLTIASPAYASFRITAPIAAGGALSAGFFLISKKAAAEAEIIKKNAQEQGLDYTKMPLYTFARRRSILLKVLAVASLAGGFGFAYHANKPAPAPHPSLAISHAIETGDNDKAMALIQAEDPELLAFDIKTNAGGALAAAIRKQNRAITKEIIDRIDAGLITGVHDRTHTNMLGLAIRNQSDEIAELIIHTIAKSYPDPIWLKGAAQANQTPLMLAVQNEDGGRIVRALVEIMRPEDLWLQGGRGGQWTALRLAAYYGKKETVKLLLSKMSHNSIQLAQNALESAREKGHTEIATLIANTIEKITIESIQKMNDTTLLSEFSKAITERNNSYALLLINNINPQLFMKKINLRAEYRSTILREAGYNYPILEALVDRLKSCKDVLIDDQEVGLVLAAKFFNEDTASVTRTAELILPMMTNEGINRALLGGGSLLEAAACSRNQAAVRALLPRTNSENLTATLTREDLAPNIRALIEEALRMRAA